MREKIEILTNDYNKIKNSAINEPKIDKFCSSEDKTPTNFKNVNEEIKNLKHKIDGKIQKHLTNAKSPSTNNLDSHQEKIKNLNQINSNLTSFVLILQNRLKLYVLFINTTLKFIKFISKGKRSTWKRFISIKNWSNFYNKNYKILILFHLGKYYKKFVLL